VSKLIVDLKYYANNYMTYVLSSLPAHRRCGLPLVQYLRVGRRHVRIFVTFPSHSFCIIKGACIVVGVVAYNSVNKFDAAALIVVIPDVGIHV
jgi:hypothetical protein